METKIIQKTKKETNATSIAEIRKVKVLRNIELENKIITQQTSNTRQLPTSCSNLNQCVFSLFFSFLFFF